METDDGEPTDPRPIPTTAIGRADRAVHHLDRLIPTLGAGRASSNSRVPLGRQTHRAVSHLIARDIEVVRVELRGAVSAVRDSLLDVEARLDAVDTRLGALDTRLAALEAQAPALINSNHSLPDGRPGPARRITDLLDRLLALEAALGAGPESIAVLLERVERLELGPDPPRDPTPKGSPESVG